jgi:fluoroquinolone resistance protein
MESTYTEGKSFDKVDLTKDPLVKGEYEACTFNSCDFSKHRPWQREVYRMPVY